MLPLIFVYSAFDDVVFLTDMSALYFLKSAISLLSLNLRNAAYFFCFQSVHVISHQGGCEGKLRGFKGFDIQLAAEVYTVVNNSIAASIFSFFCWKCLAENNLQEIIKIILYTPFVGDQMYLKFTSALYWIFYILHSSPVFI